MLEAVVAMRAIVARRLWWLHASAMHTDHNGNFDYDSMLALAAVSVTDEATALEIAMVVQPIVEAMPDAAFVHDDPQLFTLSLLDKTIAKLAGMN